MIDHQPRERSVPCRHCRANTWNVNAVCDSCKPQTKIRALITGTRTPTTLVLARPCERVQPVTTVWAYDSYSGREYSVDVITDTIRDAA